MKADVFICERAFRVLKVESKESVMDELVRIGEILSRCLTTETLKRFCVYDSNEGVLYERVSGSRSLISVLVMNYAAEVVVEEVQRNLTPEEVVLVYNRVRQFLTARGLD